ncbi:MAG: ABC transporter ATP-binding protein [Haloarculaceae archaeon]
MAAETVIEATDLRKEYGPVVAVDGVSFDIRAGEIFALVGPNGAGKTTTVEILETLRTPTGGSATVLGHDVASEERAIKERIGVVPQSFHTFERLTVRENVALIRAMYEEPLAVGEVLDELDLGEYADTQYASLSGGYQRRTGIAMALVSDPDVLFLDEPTTGLDPAARRTTWRQIERLADLGTTVVLTTHYMEEVEALADRAALLVDGTVAEVGSVDDLIASYGGDAKLVVSGVGGRAGEDESEVESVLRSAATEVYRSETGELVGLFDDRSRAQEAFSRLHRVEGDRAIDLTTAGMEDVFLELAGGTVGPGGELQ